MSPLSSNSAHVYFESTITLKWHNDCLGIQSRDIFMMTHSFSMVLFSEIKGLPKSCPICMKSARLWKTDTPFLGLQGIWSLSWWTLCLSPLTKCPPQSSMLKWDLYYEMRPLLCNYTIWAHLNLEDCITNFFSYTFLKSTIQGFQMVRLARLGLVIAPTLAQKFLTNFGLG